ncbi:FadR/GntR family transcriptional regulator [Variovorax ginsengisoli]|uniref:GntR family transcriptional repressor for pyruvate dehydrogenase complex n=1 Tax=Variovorax ginsengisoli TaxID=363844 RepID=A0ABT9S0W8_9BURK|nr:FadR/GntR family transcriptional regulator [Variovorax ginsengisoli]MDP9898003.1 GntR family transcriptional repressor for pyruvate dehydrogenase complex [Variovorax ginsengisoli]
MNDLAKSLEPRRLYQQIADKVRLLIQQGNYKDGHRLPPERDLAQQLGVSRPSLREALIALEIEGSVEIRMGSGVYVCNRTLRRSPLPPSMGESPAELMQARGALEGAVIVLACAHATPEGLARVQESVEAMRADIVAGRDVLEHDREFHVRIAELTGNSILVSLVGTLFDERRGPLASHMRERLEGRPTWNEALAEHEQILRCLHQRDPLLAESAMRSHIRAAADRWVMP